MFVLEIRLGVFYHTEDFVCHITFLFYFKIMKSVKFNSPSKYSTLTGRLPSKSVMKNGVPFPHQNPYSFFLFVVISKNEMANVNNNMKQTVPCVYSRSSDVLKRSIDLCKR